MGVRAGLVGTQTAIVHYGSGSQAAQGSQVWIEPQAQLSLSGPPHRVTLVGGLPVPHFGEPPVSLWVGNRLGFDIFRATAYWLTLQSESSVALRDPHGRPPSGQTLLAGSGMLDRPPIHEYTLLLRDRLAALGVRLRTSAKWPAGKRYAVALTHDVDAPERPWGLPGLFRLGLQQNRPRLRASYWCFRSEMRRSGFLETLVLPPARQGTWDFAKFCQIEAMSGFRSAFYFSVVPRRTGHPNDVSYDPARRRFRRLVRGLRDGGWEIGLHAAYSTCEARPTMDHQVARFRRVFGFDPVGARHHYLRLSPDAPMDTLSAHAAAGLLYDTSIGFNDAPGFRAGTAWPYAPLPTRKNMAGAFLELPMTLADMHLPREDVHAATTIVLEHLRRVREIGGLAVLNWHVGNWQSHPAWRESYRAAIRWLSDDREVWVATPEAVCRWWTSSRST